MPLLTQLYCPIVKDTSGLLHLSNLQRLHGPYDILESASQKRKLSQILSLITQDVRVLCLLINH